MSTISSFNVSTISEDIPPCQWMEKAATVAVESRDYGFYKINPPCVN